VQGALYELGIIEPSAPIEAVDAKTGLEKLNNMMSGLTAQGIDVLWPELALDDLFPLGPEHVEGVEAMLAVRLSAMPAYSTKISSELKSIATTSKQMLRADYTIQDPLRAPPELLGFSGQRRY